MSITLNGYTFDQTLTAASSAIEETGGRDARVVKIAGMVMASTVGAIEAALDAVAGAASAEELVALSLVAGRRLWVRRRSFVRGVRGDAPAGAFVLELEAPDPQEEAESATVVPWSITASGATKVCATSGTAEAKPVIALMATGEIIEPQFSDGIRTLRYGGTVGNGETLVFNGETERVELNGQDVTPYTNGDCPRVSPPQTTLTYTDAAGSSHTAAVTVTYRVRWW